MTRRALPYLTLSLLLVVWHVGAMRQSSGLFPGPVAVLEGMAELTRKGLLFRYVTASLFRVTWGYLAAVALAMPVGLALGWWRRGGRALNPMIQILRPISPLAWIPLSILWFGVGDVAAIFLIFLASFLPLTVAAMTAVRSVPATLLQAGHNFGLSDSQLLRAVILPASLPQLVVALRITLGIAWLVVVAAEMIAVNSGLGFLIVDARNAGNRYDLVVAAMVLIGLIGLALDSGMRRLETLPALRWGYAS